MMIKICLCDDDDLILNLYSCLINEISNSEGKSIKLEMFESGESLLFEVEENINRFDIIIIDILMKNLNGIEVAKMLRKYGYQGVIIFLTSSLDFALEAFGVESLNYIVKDENQIEKFKKIFSKALFKVETNQSKKIIITSNKNRKILDLENVVYMESINKKILVYYSSKKKDKISYTLNDILEKIDEYGFIRCHKSYIINLKFILSFTKSTCVLKNDILIPIGRKYYPYFKQKVSDFEFENIKL